MKILIIDDHRLFTDGLRLVINNLEGSEDYLIEQANSAQRAIDYIQAGEQYDLILTDLDMPGIDGHSLVKSLISRKVGANIAVVSGSNSILDISAAYHNGARGYIYKSESALGMQSKIRDLMDGKTCFPDEFWESTEHHPKSLNDGKTPKSSIGKRPMQVLELLAQGKSNKQISTILNITETTVKFHIRTLFNILDVNNRTWCVREAIRKGLIEPQES